VRRASTAIATTALILAACGPGADDEGGADPSPAPSPTETVEPEEPGETEEPEEPTDDVAAMTFAHCDAPLYTVGYPDDWRTNDPDEGIIGPCEIFHPSDIDEPEVARDRDLHHAVSVYVDAVAFEDRADGDGLDAVIDERETTVDGRAARVVETEGTGEALLPEGERRYAYTVDLEGEILVAATYTIGDTDHERDKRVLDRMITEELVIHDDELDPEVEPVSGPATTEESVVENEGTRLVVTDLRVGAHDGFDRVTFEIEGEGAPGWRIGYDADPRQQGSGHAVDVGGDAALHVSLTRFAYPMDAPAELRDGPQRLEPSRTSALVEVLDDSIYEGHHDFWLGIDDQRPYRVALLEAPTRVVIDIETD
jgi:hypothetical protein